MTLPLFAEPPAARARMRRDGPRIDWRLGRAVGWEVGYRAGFAAGVRVGGAGVLLAIEHALPDGVLPDLLPALPHAGEYRRLRRLRQVDNRGCRGGCGACSRCVRRAAVAGNLARHRSADYPGGGPHSWTIPAARTGRGAA